MTQVRWLLTGATDGAPLVHSKGLDEIALSHGWRGGPDLFRTQLVCRTAETITMTNLFTNN